LQEHELFNRVNCKHEQRSNLSSYINNISVTFVSWYFFVALSKARFFLLKHVGGVSKRTKRDFLLAGPQQDPAIIKYPNIPTCSLYSGATLSVSVEWRRCPSVFNDNFEFAKRPTIGF